MVSANPKELERIINRSPAVAFLCANADNWPVEYVSENVSQFGYEPDDFYSGRLTYSSIVHPDDVDRVVDEVARHSVTDHEQYRQTYRILTRSGEVRWVDDWTWVRRDDQGRITHYDGIVLDVTEMHNALASLERGERRFRELAALLPQVVYEVGEDGRITFVNERAVDVFGYTEREIMSGLHAHDMFAPEDRERLRQNIARVIEGEENEPHEYTAITKDGRRFPVIACSVRVMHDGKAVGLRGILVNVTEQKEAQRQRERFIDGLRTVVEATGELIGCATLDELCRHAVEIARERLGVERCSIFVRDEDVVRGSAGTDLERKTTDEHTNILEHRFWEGMFDVIRDRETRWQVHNGKLWNWNGRACDVIGEGWIAWTPIGRFGCVPLAVFFNDTAISKSPVDHAQQEVLAIYCSFLADLIERLHREEALRQSEDRYRHLAESAADCIFMIDSALQLSYVNAAAAKVFGGRPDELVGLPLSAVFSGTDRDYLVADVREVFGSGEARQTTHIVAIGEENPWFDTKLVPITSGSGEVTAVLGVSRDITERMRWEEALEDAKRAAEEANGLKSRFLANVSHEIRTPLNSIIGFAEIILGVDSLSAAREYARTVVKEGTVLRQLIDDLLDHAKIEAGKVELAHEPFGLHDLLRGVERSIEVRIDEKGLDFRCDMDISVPKYVVGDEMRLREILMNLLSNAVKFTEAGSVALLVETLKLTDSTARLRFSVKDTGIGIPKDKQKVIFSSFTQVDASASRTYGGTGLGTTIARCLVELMNGVIDVESEPGRGSTFWFEVELELAADAPEIRVDETVAQVRNRRLRSARILLAEDYPPNQDVAKIHLESAGHSVHVVDNGGKAVEACRTHEYDLVLMDAQMPVVDGLEATRRIRSGPAPGRDVPIVGLTASADRATARACREAGMNDIITKPIRRGSFLTVVERWLD